MKKYFKLLLCVIILGSLFACLKNSDKTVILARTRDRIEVFTSYNALDLVKNATSEEYTITVVNDTIDNNKLGTYEVTYEVTSSKNKKTEVVLTFEVVDTKAPELNINKEVTINLDDTSWKITDFVDAKDGYDGDVSDNIIIDGEYDISTVGEYRVTLKVSDSSNNTSSKTVTIYVEKNDSQTSTGLFGTYTVDYSSASSNPSLVLNQDMTFTLKFNYCAGLQTFSGNFTQSNNRLILESDGFNFGDNPSDTTVTMQINSNGTLTYLDDYPACSPVENDIFKKGS